MRFLVMTDIEGVTGVTTFQQAENSVLGREMQIHDLHAVLAGIEDAGAQAVVYDMHTDGRNVDIAAVNVPVVMGKPINGQLWRGVGGAGFDGLFLMGLHTMQHVPNALLAHSYLREYDAVYINGLKVGEIGMEAALAGEQGVPLCFVSADDLGCREATDLNPEIVTCAVKKSLGATEALCFSAAQTEKELRAAACKAAQATVRPFTLKPPYEVRVEFSDCAYLQTMKRLHPEIFADERTVLLKGDRLLAVWSEYLQYEKEMVNA